MCYERQRAQVGGQLTSIAEVTPAKTSTPSYWACQGQLAQHCGTAFNNVPRDKCMACAHNHLPELLKNGCSVNLIAKACSEPRGCTDAVRTSCAPSNITSACRKQNNTACKQCEKCAFSSQTTSAANCSFELVFNLSLIHI